MGGFGSGRKGGRTGTVEGCRSIDANRWMREGILVGGAVRWGDWKWSDAQSGEIRSRISYAVNTTRESLPTVRLTYSFTRTGERFDYGISLQTTHPRFGGLRWWFTCPLTANGVPCGRRVQKLFLPPVGKYFGCRHCYRLTYESRREDAKNRALTKTQKIRVRLGGSPAIHDPFPPKPKGMWERTYRRLRDAAKDAENQSWFLLGEWMDRGAG